MRERLETPVQELVTRPLMTLIIQTKVGHQKTHVGSVKSNIDSSDSVLVVDGIICHFGMGKRALKKRLVIPIQTCYF